MILNRFKVNYSRHSRGSLNESETPQSSNATVTALQLYTVAT